MALIDCPECGRQVSDRAPTCPQCGVPIAIPASAPGAAATAAAAPANAAVLGDSHSLHAQESAAASSPTTETDTAASKHETVEPFRIRIAGRPVPVAGILFWGGMVLGMGLKYLLPPTAEAEAEPEIWRVVPWVMIWCGVLWFAVTEFGALLKSKLSRR
ncbi:zinc ribbon domain-containing protein [Halochromatium sp.]